MKTHSVLTGSKLHTTIDKREDINYWRNKNWKFDEN